MKEIRLSNGQFALVDDSDFPLLSRHNWKVQEGYAVTSIGGARKMFMHRMVHGSMGSGRVIDHIDRNVLNNQSSNLRSVSYAVNYLNRPIGIRKSGSLYRGVGPKGNKWYARIKSEGKMQNLGVYTTQEEAAQAYNVAAVRIYGVLAILNVLPEERKAA